MNYITHLSRETCANGIGRSSDCFWARSIVSDEGNENPWNPARAGSARSFDKRLNHRPRPVEHIRKTRILTGGCQQSDSFRRGRERGRRLAFLICILTGFLKVMNILNARVFRAAAPPPAVSAAAKLLSLPLLRRPINCRASISGHFCRPITLLRTSSPISGRLAQRKKIYLSNASPSAAYSRQCRRPIAIRFRVNIIGRRRRRCYIRLWYMHAANDKVEFPGKKDAFATRTDKNMVIPAEC